LSAARRTGAVVEEELARCFIRARAEELDGLEAARRWNSARTSPFIEVKVDGFPMPSSDSK
jgi:hypothetical protein